MCCQGHNPFQHQHDLLAEAMPAIDYAVHAETTGSTCYLHVGFLASPALPCTYACSMPFWQLESGRCVMEEGDQPGPPPPSPAALTQCMRLQGQTSCVSFIAGRAGAADLLKARALALFQTMCDYHCQPFINFLQGKAQYHSALALALKCILQEAGKPTALLRSCASLIRPHALSIESDDASLRVQAPPRAHHPRHHAGPYHELETVCSRHQRKPDE